MKIYFIIITILSLLVISCDGDSNPVSSIPGCIDELACNHTSGATADDGSCVYSGTCTLSDGTDFSSLYDTPHECDNSGSCWDLVVTGNEMTDLNTEELCYADASCSSCSNIIMDTYEECIDSNVNGQWTENSLDQTACEAYICVNQDQEIVSAESESDCQSVGVCFGADVDGDGMSSDDEDNQPTNQSDCETYGGYWIPVGTYWVQSGTWTSSAYYWLGDSSMIWTNTCDE